MIEETTEEMRARIEARDGRMKEDLQQNFSGRTWIDLRGRTWVDVIGEDVSNGQ